MLDRYTWGNTSRISPEAPIPVLIADQDEVRPGGAAYVASLLASLGCEVRLAGVVGDDAEASILRTILAEQGVALDGINSGETGRPTTSKLRFMGRVEDRHAQQILRVDREKSDRIPEEIEARLRSFLATACELSDAVVVSDYGKGVVGPSLLRFVRTECLRHHLPLLIDPIPGRSLDFYAGATLLKPNRRESEQLLRRSLHSFATYQDAAKELLRQAEAESVAMTLDHEGIVAADHHQVTHIPASPRVAHDITGAGDVVISVLAYGYAAGWNLADAAQIANLAAGVAVEKFGAELLTWNEIHASVGQQSLRSSFKISSLEEVLAFTENAKRLGQTVIFTNGCFDLLHSGHLTTLEEASRLGDVLIVAVNSDASVSRLKGPGRPIQDQVHRARMLAGLQCVSRVIVFDDPTPISLLEVIRPDVLIKGGTTGEIVGREVVQEYGGRVVQTHVAGELSTTSLIQHIHRQASKRDKTQETCP